MAEEQGAPTIRVQDKCAWCGHALAVVDRAWERVSSDTARVICANYCNGDNGCAHPACPKNCHVRGEINPEKVIPEIQRRQVAVRRAEERRKKEARARS